MGIYTNIIASQVRRYSMSNQDGLAEFGDLWALMYITFAREMVDSFGNEGKEALIRAVRTYGRTRGLRLKENHLKQGLPITLRSLFENYDLPAHPATEKTRTEFTDDKLVSYTYVCPYERVWRSEKASDLGRIYCENFHQAMWQAYRADIDVQIPEILTKDDPHCKFLVSQPKT